MIRQRVSLPKTSRQRFANVSVRKKSFPKDSPMIRQRVNPPNQSPKDSPKIRQRVSSPKQHSPKICQRFANVSVRQKVFPKDLPMIRQRVSSPKTIPQRSANDLPSCQFYKKSAKRKSQRFPNVSVPQKPFAKHSPKIRQRVR